ncbi:hypothetical protein D3C78_1510820 [compost metagenome]
MVATDRRLIAWEYRVPIDWLRSSWLCMLRARRRCGRISSHRARSRAENFAADSGRVMRKRSLPESGVAMSTPMTWNTPFGPHQCW